MPAEREDGAAVAEKRSAAESAENGSGNGSFDPGLETGHLRSAPRDHELEVELGAAPFEPGPGTGFDNRRARRAHKRREKEERKRRERAEREERKRAERERAEAARAKLATDQAEHERAVREQERVRLAEEERVRRRQAEEEQLERRRLERVRLQAERQREGAERRAEHERHERAEKLRRKREHSLRQHDERAERMRARRRQMEEPSPEPEPQPQPKASPEPEVVVAPAVTKAPPAPVRPIPHHSLKRPTLKAAVALAAITAAAVGAGALLGLPLPGLGSDSETSNASLAAGSLSPLDSGTPVSLTEGPFLPIRGKFDYGEKDARFGVARPGHTHEGQDMFAKAGTPELAVRDGVIVDRGKVNGRYSGGRGNYLVIYSPLDNRSFVYMHMLQPSPLFVGDQVTAGQQVGQLGCTGTCFGPHLHFEIRIGKASLRSETKPLDPLPYLRQWPQAPAPAAPGT